MSDLRATNFKGRTSGSVPNMPDGVVVGSAVTISSSGIDVGVGVITATTFSGSVSSSTGSFSGDVDIADKIVHTGDTNTAIRFPAADTFTVETAGSERLRVNSSGLVGIGTDNPSSPLTVKEVSNVAIELLKTTNASILTLGEDGSSGGNINAPNGDLLLSQGGTERLRIDSGGRLGIGTDSPSSYSSSTNNLVISETGGNSGITLHTGSSTASYLGFTDTGDTNNQGYIGYKHSDNALVFAANSAEAFRVDSSQRLLIGSTSARANFNNGTRTAFLQLEGTSSNIDSSSIALVYNQNSTGNASNIYFGKTRGGSDGDNSALNQAGDRLGNISFQGNDGTQFVDAAHIRAFTDGTPGADDMPGRLVFSTTADGASSPTERMRIHSSGVVSFNNGIELGSGLDATAANTLDDYEEGTFTPTINTGFTAGYNSQAGRYTKVGNVVHFFISIDLSSLSGSSSDTYAEVEGLPFTATNTGNIDNAVTVAWQMNLGNSVIHAYIEQNATHIVLLAQPSSGSRSHLTPAEVWDDSDGRIALSGTYTTAS